MKTEDNNIEQKPKENNGDLTEMPLEVKLETGEDQNYHDQNDDQYFSETNPEDLENIEDSKEFIVKEYLSDSEEPIVKKRGRKRKIKNIENENETEAVKTKQTVCNHVEKAFPFYRLISNYLALDFTFNYVGGNK